MSGYNDSSDMFDDAVDAVVAEAQRQAIPHVIWLTLRTADVSYQDPQQRASTDGYREDNRVLHQKAAQLGGYLQIADWATHSDDRSDWFYGDGVHLTDDGVSSLSSFIADSVDVVLAGGSLNPDVAPWATLAPGDTGDTVADVQQALVAAGVATVGVPDGEYGDLTTQAVAEFQRGRGLTVTGVVNESTAIALGVHGQPATAVGHRAGASHIRRPAPDHAIRLRSRCPAGADRAPTSCVGWRSPRPWSAPSVLLASQRRRQRWELPEDMLDEPVMATPPYDHELEDVLVH